MIYILEKIKTRPYIPLLFFVFILSVSQSFVEFLNFIEFVSISGYAYFGISHHPAASVIASFIVLGWIIEQLSRSESPLEPRPHQVILIPLAILNALSVLIFITLVGCIFWLPIISYFIASLFIEAYRESSTEYK